MAPPTKGQARTAPVGFADQPAPVKAMLGLLIVALLGVGYYFALHAPMQEAIDDANRRYLQLQDQLQEAESRQREYIRLREELAAREGLDRANMRILPEDAEMPSFLQDLHRLAETSGLQIRLVEPRPEEPGEQYVKLPVALEVRGRYHQLARFFYNVSRLERAISMENVRLAEPRTVGEDVVVDAHVRATTFRRPSAEEAAQRGSQTGGG